MLAAVIVFAPGLVLNLLQPVIESLRVKPDELRIEKPYLAANISLTRDAYKLDKIDVMPFPAGGDLRGPRWNRTRPRSTTSACGTRAR